MKIKSFATLAVGLVALTLPSTAQGAFRWGPTAGVNINTLHWKQKLLTTSSTAGAQAGVMGELMIPGIGFGVDFGLKYSMQGAKVNFGEYPVWSVSGLGDETVTIHNLEIPLDLRFKWTRMDGLEEIVAPFAYAGPAFVFNLADNKCSALEYPAGYLAIRCGLGLEFIKKIQLSAGYSWGVSYITRTVKLDNLSAQPRSWNIALTYLF
ncbi:MAG: PorT family protein [Muribaculaceae bacterium]|nr:PorT family protein [Muribaculaceae bacterium]